jgi:hypothetical protein
MDKLSWTLLEYEEKEKNTDWFWALGIIIIAGSVTAFIYNNYFFSILLIIGGILVGFFAKKKPDMVNYELNIKGFKIKDRIFLYKDIEAFHIDTKKIPVMLIKTNRFLFPVLSIPIEYLHIDEIRNILLSQNIKEEEIKETIPDKIMEYLDF